MWIHVGAASAWFYYIFHKIQKDPYHWYHGWQNFKGYFDSYHCNFWTLEKHHYNSRILKRTITILRFQKKCHLIRMEMTWAQLQLYMNTYTSLQPLSSITDVRASLVIFFFLLSTIPQSDSATGGALFIPLSMCYPGRIELFGFLWL